MGYKINSGEKGIKILIPQFCTIVKVQNNINDYELKTLYLLTDEEKKIYKDISDDRITFFDKKLTNFKIGFVFDASQTDMPLDVIKEQLNPVLEDPSADGIADTFLKAIYKDGFKVKYEDVIEGGAKGYCNIKDKTIIIKNGLGNLMKLKVLVHEYAHGLAHQHLKDNGKDYQEHRNQYETEAESISYVVSKFLGLDTSTYSFNYLYSWSKEKDFKEIDDSFSIIINYSKKIIENYKKMYEENMGLYSDYYREYKV